MDSESENKSNITESKTSTEKTFLIILTILILGPIVFFGSCFPIGFIGLASMGESFMPISVFFAFLIGISLTIIICRRIIKRISNPNSKLNLGDLIFVIILIAVIIFDYYLLRGLSNL